MFVEPLKLVWTLVGVAVHRAEGGKATISLVKLAAFASVEDWLIVGGQRALCGVCVG